MSRIDENLIKLQSLIAKLNDMKQYPPEASESENFNMMCGICIGYIELLQSRLNHFIRVFKSSDWTSRESLELRDDLVILLQPLTKQANSLRIEISSTILDLIYNNPIE